jgi:hypothetical protein
MGTYVTVHAIYVPNPHAPDKPERDVLALPDTEIELSDELAKGHLEVGAIRAKDEPAPDPEPASVATQLERPSANASKDDWRTYAIALGVENLPTDAKRDEIIAAVDAHQTP